MKQYLEALEYILENGSSRSNTISVFGMQQRYDLTKGFPLVTTKKMAFKAITSELLWFLEGSTDERRLAEILHGTRSEDKQTIWTANASAASWASKAKFAGDCGNIYGKQWRNFGGVDQYLDLLEGLKANPTGRRHIISAWNPPEMDNMCLPPCHALSQFYIDGRHLSCQLYQRSCDMFLGVPFNIASYAMLTYIVAKEVGLLPGEFIHTLGDAHIYNIHMEQVKEQLTRQPMELPKLVIKDGVLTMDSFILENYKSYPTIKAEMILT